MRAMTWERRVSNSVPDENGRGGARYSGRDDDTHGMVVAVSDYGVRGNYCCPSCDCSTLVQSTDQAVDFVCANCDEWIRERGRKYD